MYFSARFGDVNISSSWHNTLNLLQQLILFNINTLQMEKVRSVSQDLHSRVPDSTVEKAATRAALQSLLEYHDSFSLEVEREQSILALLGQHARSLRGDEEREEMEKETPCLQEIRSMQEKYDR